MAKNQPLPRMYVGIGLHDQPNLVVDVERFEVQRLPCTPPISRAPCRKEQNGEFRHGYTPTAKWERTHTQAQNAIDAVAPFECSGFQTWSPNRRERCENAPSYFTSKEHSVKTCLYCGVDKDESEYSTLEHAIPQFLGGAQTSIRFKLRNACNGCNSNLGLFVDGSFGKTWWVSNWIATMWGSAYTSSSDVGIPLVCMGLSELSLPGMQENEVCEVWLGPLGEQVFLVRPKDERLYWYVGGNPIAAKKKSSTARAYFFISQASSLDVRRTWLSFRDAFKGKRVKKIMCCEVVGANPHDIGFEDPDELDEQRIEVLKVVTSNNERKVGVPFNPSYDVRFMCKLAIGVGYSVFGEVFLNSAYTAELRNGLKNRDERASGVRGMQASNANPHMDAPREHLGIENAVVVTVLKIGSDICLVLNIGKKLIWTVAVASEEAVIAAFPREYEHGFVLVLFPQLNRGMELTLPDFLAHQTRDIPNAEIIELEALACRGVTPGAAVSPSR